MRGLRPSMSSASRMFLQDAAAGAIALVESRLNDAISAGELPASFRVTARASQVIDLSRGLAMRANGRATHETA